MATDPEVSSDVSRRAAEVESLVLRVVAELPVVDLHTHLFPPTYSRTSGIGLFLSGVDELLCYHYLVAEFFMTAPRSMTPEAFFALPKQSQADLVWQPPCVYPAPRAGRLVS
mmetsp:Transcript_50869/g.115540  ORF Transcript_50869/g.115540 Transcript_50869/m.115540 type:complete len:112 (+) Transcript_50869:132-467(+)